MGESCNKTLCTNCIHLNVCAIKADYLKIFEMLPTHDDNFSLKVGCKHYFGTTTIELNNSTIKLNNSKSSEIMNNFINYDTTTGNPLRSKIDI